LPYHRRSLCPVPKRSFDSLRGHRDRVLNHRKTSEIGWVFLAFSSPIFASSSAVSEKRSRNPLGFVLDCLRRFERRGTRVHGGEMPQKKRKKPSWPFSIGANPCGRTAQRSRSASPVGNAQPKGAAPVELRFCGRSFQSPINLCATPPATNGQLHRSKRARTFYAENIGSCCRVPSGR